MKICIITTMFPKYKGDYYGSFVYDEVKSLVNRGFEVHVITQHNPNIPYEEIMDGIYVHRFKWLEPKEFKALVHFSGFIDNLRLITYVISLFINTIKIITKYKINLLHAHSAIPTGLISAIVAKIMNLSLFVTVHGMDINNFIDNRFYRCLISFSLNNSNLVIAVSTNLAKNMENMGIKPDKIIVLRNAVDMNRFKPFKNNKLRNNYKIKEDNVLILFVGYLDTFKGIFDLIYAFNEINRKNENAKLMIVGTGPKELELKKEVSKLVLSNNILFTGKISPKVIQNYYQIADIFILPSHTEGLPLVVIEAMASGLPVIATNVGGIPEVVENGSNGFLISPKDKKDLVKKLDILINNENLRDNFSACSREIIENNFNFDEKISKLIGYYTKYNKSK